MFASLLGKLVRKPRVYTLGVGGKFKPHKLHPIGKGASFWAAPFPHSALPQHNRTQSYTVS